MEIPISVGISSDTLEAWVLRGRLPPHPVPLSNSEVAVRIEKWQEVPVQLVQEVRMIVLILHKLIEHPGVDSGSNNLPGVDTTVNPHGGLIAAAALADL